MHIGKESRNTWHSMIFDLTRTQYQTDLLVVYRGSFQEEFMWDITAITKRKGSLCLRLDSCYILESLKQAVH